MRSAYILGAVWILTATLQWASFAHAQTGRLSVRVVDNETGEPMAARLALQASDGTWPGDRLGCSAARWPHIEAHGVFIPGQQTFELPAGRTSILAAHGLEYRPASQVVDVRSGEPAQVELRLARVANMREAGWVAGDIHVHMVHGENERQTSYQEIATACAANGLDFVYVGQEYVGAGQLDLAGYEAECRKVSTGGFQMFLGGERPKSLLGHQALFGVPNPFLIAEDPPYFRSARKVHAEGGALVYVHPVRYYPGRQWQGKWLDFPGNNLARELIFDAYAGPSFDGLSVLSDEPANDAAYQLWFNLLNRGFFVPVFADSDACFDRAFLGLKAPGFWTTYFHVGPGGRIDRESLVAAVRGGRTIATTGPLLQFQIDGQVSGGTLAPDGKPHTVTIEARAPQHAFSLQTTAAGGEPYGIARVELIRNGQVIETWQPRTPEVRIEHTITEAETAWYVARVFGSDERWQVAVASPIYFAQEPLGAKRQPLTARVRGRIYDFATGQPRKGQVQIRYDDQVLKRFEADGRFQVDMPIDAQIVVDAAGFRPLGKNLLMDYGPVHRFLWYLQSEDLGKTETLDMFELLMRSVDLEFPLGYRMPGCYFVDVASTSRPAGGNPFESVRVLGGPEKVANGTVALASILLDCERVSPGDTIHAAAIFRDEGSAGQVGPLVVEARGYDPSRPTAYGALKKFAEFEKTWDAAIDLGDGYRLVTGELAVPEWVEPGPTGAVDISARARHAGGHATFAALQIPLGPTRRVISLSSGWPAMPLSWPDGNYGLGPLKITNRNGREGAPKSDYRQLHLQIKVAGESLDVLPVRDGRGCPDADDAVFTGHFFDQVLSDESHLAQRPTIREQPEVSWAGIPVIDASGVR
ncbi:MAG: CehA/McbA family metallohydrolase [Pirellulales bacterium]